LEYKQLGKTGLRVSRIALGTVELGLDYGFRDSQRYTRPKPEDATRVLHRAFELGINFIDTARTYGDSERLIGSALHQLRHPAVIASKVDISAAALHSGDEQFLANEISNSIESSLKALQLDSIDLMQIHETTLEVIRKDQVIRSLEDARQQGKIRFIGVSCRDQEVALAALQTGKFDALQVPFNLLNRGMSTQVFSDANSRHVGLLARSIFLRGVLTDNINNIPKRLLPLKKAAFVALERCKHGVQSLSELALRFTLSYDEVTSVILGVRSLLELELNVADFQKGPLSHPDVVKLRQICVSDPSLLEPHNWSDLI